MENRETGKVVEVSAQGTARVLIQRKKWCDRCPSKSVCNPPEEGKEFTIEVDNTIGAREGDIVEIGLPGKSLFIASVWAYLVPSLLFIAGIAIGFLVLSRFVHFLSRELLGFLIGIIFLAVSFGILRIVNNWLGKKKTFRPEIIGICSKNSATV
jgi:sigma-E factor negative regulatory protein RseC